MNATRQALISRLFPAGIPKLWCPNITHTASPRVPDSKRIRQHLQTISPHVKGLLVPGSTGEGWVMSDAEALNVLGVNLDVTRELSMVVLVGVLKTDVHAMKECIHRVLDFLRQRTGESDPIAALIRSGVAGFTVCPPSGRDKTQAELEAGLTELLALKLPMALYQLPQVTKNEMSPELIERLAGRFPNFILFKDTSGTDTVATSGRDFGGVFLVRGAEGAYTRWPQPRGGPYDGFLLASANIFAGELAVALAPSLDSLSLQKLGNVETVIRLMFELVNGLTIGNPFANAIKLLDHCLAFGELARQMAPPMLFDGQRLPGEMIHPTTELLKSLELLPDRGYAAES